MARLRYHRVEFPVPQPPAGAPRVHRCTLCHVDSTVHAPHCTLVGGSGTPDQVTDAGYEPTSAERTPEWVQEKSMP